MAIETQNTTPTQNSQNRETNRQEQAAVPQSTDLNKLVAQRNLAREAYQNLLTNIRRIEKQSQPSKPQQELLNGAKKLLASVNGALKRSTQYIDQAQETGSILRDPQRDAQDTHALLKARDHIKKMSRLA